MSNPLFAKLGMIALITFILILAIFTVSGTVSDRKQYKNQAKETVARSWTGGQEVFGPVLVVPYVLEWTVEEWDQRRNNKILRQEKLQAEKYLIAESLTHIVSLTTDIRHKGIFQIPVYASTIQMQGLFTFNSESVDIDTSQIEGKNIKIEFGTPHLGIGLSDPRGISENSHLLWGTTAVPFKAGSGIGYLTKGLHAPISMDLTTGTVEQIPFEITLGLRGLDQITFHPVAQNYQLNMQSPWPHPSFIGNFLPTQREIDDTGFTATWAVTEFASNIRALLETCSGAQCALHPEQGIGVSLIQPVDIYLKTERSLKYALLFITLVFVAFFIFEVLRLLPIHPIQYGLVGAAISTFYLLLISLSEHIEFFTSYVIAAGACVLLISFYLVYVLKSVSTAAIFGCLLSIIYAMLYVIVSAEDYALLMGTFVVFSVIAIIMIATRNINWYQIEWQNVEINNPLDHSQANSKERTPDKES